MGVPQNNRSSPEGSMTFEPRTLFAVEADFYQAEADGAGDVALKALFDHVVALPLPAEFDDILRRIDQRHSC